MKPLVYISGIGGGMLLILGTWGVLFEIRVAGLFLLFGLIFILAFFVFSWIQRKDSDRRIDEIIRSHKGKKEPEEMRKPKEVPKGWGMNDSPFRERQIWPGMEWWQCERLNCHAYFKKEVYELGYKLLLIDLFPKFFHS